MQRIQLAAKIAFEFYMCVCLLFICLLCRPGYEAQQSRHGLFHIAVSSEIMSSTGWLLSRALSHHPLNGARSVRTHVLWLHVRLLLLWFRGSWS